MEKKIRFHFETAFIKFNFSKIKQSFFSKNSVNISEFTLVNATVRTQEDLRYE